MASTGTSSTATATSKDSDPSASPKVIYIKEKFYCIVYKLIQTYCNLKI